MAGFLKSKRVWVLRGLVILFVALLVVGWMLPYSSRFEVDPIVCGAMKFIGGVGLAQLLTVLFFGGERRVWGLSKEGRLKGQEAVVIAAVVFLFGYGLYEFALPVAREVRIYKNMPVHQAQKAITERAAKIKEYGLCLDRSGAVTEKTAKRVRESQWASLPGGASKKVSADRQSKKMMKAYWVEDCSGSSMGRAPQEEILSQDRSHRRVGQGKGAC